jgi:hypothetical protein
MRKQKRCLLPSAMAMAAQPLQARAALAGGRVGAPRRAARAPCAAAGRPPARPPFNPFDTSPEDASSFSSFNDGEPTLPEANAFEPAEVELACYADETPSGGEDAAESSAAADRVAEGAARRRDACGEP